MKTNLLYLILLSSLPLFLHAQVEDDMYYLPVKKKNVEKKKTENGFRLEALDNDTVFIGNTSGSRLSDRDIDVYNRRYGSGAFGYNDNDTLYITDDVQATDKYEPTYEEDDYVYSQRIMRFHSPAIGVYVSSPYYWDVCYSPFGLSWYDTWYDDPWYRPIGYDWHFHVGWHSPWYYHRPYYGHWWHHPVAYRPGNHSLYRPGSRPIMGARPSNPGHIARTTGRPMRGSNGTSPSLRPSRENTLERRRPQTETFRGSQNRPQRTERGSSPLYRGGESMSRMRQSPVSGPTIRHSAPAVRQGGSSVGRRNGGGRR